MHGKRGRKRTSSASASRRIVGDGTHQIVINGLRKAGWRRNEGGAQSPSAYFRKPSSDEYCLTESRSE